MNYFSLICAQLLRSKTRSLLTLFSVVVAFLLFGMLDAVRSSFKHANSIDGANRLVVTSRLSFTQSLPISLLTRIESLEGVSEVAYAMWFGGVYREQRNFFPSFSVSPNYFRVHPQLQLPAEQLKAFTDTRSGAIVGESLANRYGWKVGDTIPLQASSFSRGGSNDWPLQLVGIFRSQQRSNASSEENQLFMHWKYFDEANDYVKGKVSWYAVTLKDAEQATQVARAIDALSANSDRETLSQSESAWRQSFVKQFGDIGMIVSAIIGAVFFTLLLLTGNTMAQTVRERVPELATLKALGFADRSVLWLVLSESLLLVGLGGGIGLALACALLPLISPHSQSLLPPTIPLSTWLSGAALVLLIGVVVGVLPAVRAQRLKIVDALAGR